MNTSDRSIAMVDAAIRRRFAFVELHPQDGIISGLLERFLKANGKPSLRADLLNALNNEIEDTNRDLMIGPSYFMKPHAETDEGLEEIWKYELLPLLEEQYFGRLKRDQVREKFGLAAMRRKAASAAQRRGGHGSATAHASTVAGSSWEASQSAKRLRGLSQRHNHTESRSPGASSWA